MRRWALLFGVVCGAVGCGEGEKNSSSGESVSSSQTSESSAPQKEVPFGPLSAPAELPIGSDFEADWDGPRIEGDRIAIGAVGSPLGKEEFSIIHRQRSGRPLPMLIPPVPGDYELRYISGDPPELLGRRGIRATDFPVQIEEVPASIMARAKLEPYMSDTPTGNGQSWYNCHFALGKKGRPIAEAEIFGNSSYGSTVAPSSPGDYTLYCVYTEDHRVILASADFTVVALQTKLTAPASVALTEKFGLQIDGPGSQGDCIVIARIGGAQNEILGKPVYVDQVSSTIVLTAPAVPGRYEFRYLFGGVEGETLATTQFEVQSVKISIDAPERVTVGEDLEINWRGPKGARLRIVEDGKPRRIYGQSKPSDSGGYILRGKLGTRPVGAEGIADDRHEELGAFSTAEIQCIGLPVDGRGDPPILFRTAVEIEEAKATLSAPESVKAGEGIDVSWTGPGLRDDRIVLAEADSSDFKSVLRRRLEGVNGQKTRLFGVDKPGDYEFRYTVEERVIARRPLRIVE